MSSHTNAYAFNKSQQAFLATDLRIASTHWARLKGLLGSTRKVFTAGLGLWIVPCHGVHTMGMSFPIDVLYLDADFLVVHLEQNVKPWRITPVRLEAATVVELPANTIVNTGTCIGDHIEISATPSVAQRQGKTSSQS